MKKVALYLTVFLVLSSLVIVEHSEPASQEVIKIGHIRPLTGNLAATSDLMVKSFDLAFQQINYQVAGKQIQIVVGDSQGNPQASTDVAKKMVENDKVAMIVGPTTVAENAAIANYLNQVGIPHITTSQIPYNIIIADKWVVGVGGTSEQLCSSMGVYAYDHLKYRKLDILTQDTGSGKAYLGAFINAFKNKGGQIVQEQYTAFPAPDFAPYLTTLKDADALAVWTNGADAIKFLTQYHEMGIAKKLPLLGAYHGAFLSPFTLKALPPAAAEATIGKLVPTPYSPFLDNAVNKKFVPLIQSKMNLVPDDTESALYQTGMAIIEALKATGGDTTPAKLRQALLSLDFEGPQGRMKFDPQTAVAIKTTYICKVMKQGNDYLWQSVFTYNDVPAKGF
jgi:branched-chain amino acid transport system substrate-binding protein